MRHFRLLRQDQIRHFSTTNPPRKSVTSSLHFYGTGVSPRLTAGRQLNMLRMIMFGKPGSGKGTLSNRLLERYDLSFVSCGDLLRQHIVDKTKVGQMAEKLMSSGDLVPDEIITQITTERLDRLKSRHWILDGFPRTVSQGELLDRHLDVTGYPLSLVVILDVPDDVILDRIANRWIHQPSGRIYNMSYNRPLVAGRDDVTGEKLTKRPDDNPDIFERRLRNYYQSTMPLVSYFQSRQSSKFRVVSLTGKTSDEIWPQLIGTMEKWFPLREKTLLPLANQDLDQENNIIQ